MTRPILLLSICLGLVGCGASGLLRTVRTARLQGGSRLGVIVISDQDADRAALEAYFFATLVDRGFIVAPLKPSHYLHPKVLQQILSSVPHTRLQNATKPTVTMPPADAMKPPSLETEVYGAMPRFEALIDLLHQGPRKLLLRYVIVVQQIGKLGLAAYTLDVKNRRLINVVVVTGNGAGVRFVLGEIKATAKIVTIGATDGDETRLHLLRFAEYVSFYL